MPIKPGDIVYRGRHNREKGVGIYTITLTDDRQYQLRYQKYKAVDGKALSSKPSQDLTTTHADLVIAIQAALGEADTLYNVG